MLQPRPPAKTTVAAEMQGARALRSKLVLASEKSQIHYNDLDVCELLGQGAYGMSTG